jgi:NAD(P)-dependent dehydrogenase (short-subunit alcohol dehydrogenase family)
MGWPVNGKTVFVTGAARGIGAESARRFHAKGANVALVGLEPEELERLAADLGDRAEAFEADVTDADALDRAVDGAVERFGGIDVAIANAGINMSGTISKGRVEAIERVLEVNLMGVWRTDRAVLPQIIEREGYLLNIASLAAASHAPMMGPYATAKAGVEALSNCLRQELALTGARVGCAYFGFIDTDLVRAGFEEPSTQVMRREMPGFLTKTAPLSKAVDAIENGVERRAARVWAPRYVGPILALRGILQPLTERRAMRSSHLAEALRLADPEQGGGERDDPLLGTSAAAR